MATYRKERYLRLEKVMDDNYASFLELKDPEWFLEWLWNNIHIYDEFERYSKKLFYDGKRKYYSGWAIINKMRWDTLFREAQPSDFKISNDSVAYLTRLVMHVNPQLSGMFKTKEGKNVGDKREIDPVQCDGEEDNP